MVSEEELEDEGLHQVLRPMRKLIRRCMRLKTSWSG
jgi:hypothetical protein